MKHKFNVGDIVANRKRNLIFRIIKIDDRGRVEEKSYIIRILKYTLYKHLENEEHSVFINTIDGRFKKISEENAMVEML